MQLLICEKKTNIEYYVKPHNTHTDWVIKGGGGINLSMDLQT